MPLKPPQLAGISPAMTSRIGYAAALLALVVAGLGAQAPQAVDTSKIGPQVGAAVPAFEGTDQFGKTRSLSSVYGPKGAMVVFFRSADW